jgi:hypothetical protein
MGLGKSGHFLTFCRWEELNRKYAGMLPYDSSSHQVYSIFCSTRGTTILST